MKTGLKIVLIVTAIYSLTACNTVKGVGQDLKDLGEKIENSADKQRGQ